MEPDQVATDPGSALAISPDWRALVDRLGLSYFACPDWIVAWWETIADGAEGEVAVWRDRNGSPEAVVSLARRGERLHGRAPVAIPVWTNMGSGAGAADHCAFAIATRRSGDVHVWLVRRARGRPLLLRDLDPEVGVRGVPPGSRLVARTPCPRLEIPDGDEEVGRSSNFRQQLQSSRHRADRAGVRFRWIAPGEMTADVLEILLELHTRRRASLGLGTSFDRGRLTFHRRLIELGEGVRGPAAVIAERNGAAVGVLYGFLWRNVFAYYQSGWDPSLERIRLGYLLIAHAIGSSREAGARWFDLLRGVEPYKYRFGAFDRIDETWLLPSGPAGALLHATFRAKQWMAGESIGPRTVEHQRPGSGDHGLSVRAGSRRSS